MALTATATRPNTQARILDAAFQCVSDLGLARTTVEDVARSAGLSRQTIYRYFPSKEHLVMALVLREEELFLDGARDAFAAAPDLEDAVYRGVLFCLRFAREHPLLDRLLERDAETLLPYLTTRAAPVIVRARDEIIQLLSSKAWVRADLLEEAADLTVRATISYALSPPDRDPELVAHDVAGILAGALTTKKPRGQGGSLR
jgi:AcrR family transcriptional regulator